MTPSDQIRQSSKPAQRLEQLAQWVQQQLVPAEEHLTDAVQLLPVGGDAGFRSYYRLQSPQGSLLAVDAPPEQEDSAAFVSIAGVLSDAGIRVPEIKAVNYDLGFMLIEDFGDTLLLNLLDQQTVDGVYADAFSLLKNIQATSPETLPEYDVALLQTELDLFKDWFLQQLMGIELTEEEEKLFRGLDQMLIASALEQPSVFIHRDYHSRNLMHLPDGQIGVIDFQGALHGPVLYDAVSLLKDCYVTWTPWQVEGWLKSFVSQHELLKDTDWTTCQRWFDWLGLQRHLKCLGIFTRLWLRDNKPQYLSAIPATFRYVLEVCQRYPAFEQHGQWLNKRVALLLSQKIVDITAQTSSQMRDMPVVEASASEHSSAENRSTKSSSTKKDQSVNS
ncbi:aminoglycoside phosphotransferase family protein [Endozoicomonas montiporae]|uniref:Aminoglycoside phosphotransferase n=1 Tax=Endozoicomonas montiporae CL-33 TaxID=570277 RepID=A0A142BFY8_9GAMM|nr:phosphotransferase [Endozoicomonas montiporae]AMO57664.1 aminoglycoside phosphotransferase [Endozoicomonas montiporae CL-33]